MTDFELNSVGEDMHALAKELFPICRSLTGAGVRETLRILSQRLPEFEVHSLRSGEQVFDWIVPDEWNIESARLTGPKGEVVADFNDSNLHVVGYSTPVDTKLSLEDLLPHLHTLPEMPEAIPYVTSYYKRNWGFCLNHKTYQALEKGQYHAQITSSLEPGELNWGEVVLPGESTEEVLISTYVCHPSLANNELSGPVVSTFLLKWLQGLPRRRYTYRFLFLPETIGAIAYLSKNLEKLKERVVAGFVLSCIGDERCTSFVHSRRGDTTADRVAQAMLQCQEGPTREHSFLERGSDERQYCSPGVDLPVVTLCRSKFGEYPEYHTSLDNLELVTPRGLAAGFQWAKDCVQLLELNRKYQTQVLCEPQLGRRNLYPNVSKLGSTHNTRDLLNVYMYCDGTRNLIELAEFLNLPVKTCMTLAEKLLAAQVIRPA